MIKIMKKQVLYLFLVLCIFLFKIESFAFWQKEEVVVKEEKEKLSLFDRIDGKKANVVKITKTKWKWLLDENDKSSYVSDTYYLIPIGKNDGNYKSDFAYKYYFDKDGYLITDNISKDYTILNKEGIEVDNELKPVLYFIGEEPDSKEDVYIASEHKIEREGTPSQIILSPGVVLKSKVEKVFNTHIDKDINKYISGGSGYQNNVKGTIFTNAKWKKAIKLKGNGSYIVFENYVHNFNKITGKVAIENTLSSERNTKCELIVINKEDFDKGYLDEPIFTTNSFNYTDAYPFSFTFDRSVSYIVFILKVDGKNTSRNIYFKDLKFGFSKNAYKEELERKREEQEEIDYLKSLGLYTEEDIYFDIIEEDGDIVDELEIELDENMDIDDYFESDKYYDDLVNRYTGPAFDKKLIDIGNKKPIGPYYDIIGTASEISEKRKKKSKIIFID